MRDHPFRVAAAVSAIAAVVAGASAEGQMSRMQAAKPPAPIRTTMSALHKNGGVPPGWKFLMPPGDAAEGRKVFVAMECFACHDVKGEDFPRESKTPRGSGPELTAMGAHHPAEYFAESIVNPNRVIVEGSGYLGPDGLSRMPSYGDTMTIKQLVDVVAYLKSLTTGEMTHGQHDMPMGDTMKKPMDDTTKKK
jgi:mono/diheme cytochrome c family protein